MNASSGMFSGTLKGADGEFSGTLRGNDIIGATITGANGDFTKGFKVNVNMPFALSLSGRGTATVDINNSQLAFGVSWSENDFTGIKIDDESINFITVPHPASEYNSLQFITIDNQNLYNIITNMIANNVVKTSKIDAMYESSLYSTLGNNIIKFRNVENKKLYGATCDYVQKYVTDNINSLDKKYAPKSHTHSYTTKSDVESIVRKLVKSSALK